MDKVASQIKVYEHLLSYFLPAGILDFFEVTWVDERSLSSRESKQGVLYTSILQIHLDERDNRPEGMEDFRPNGFTEPTIVNDFPVRDRKMELHIRRRRWQTPDGHNLVLNVYQLAVTGTRYSAEFAAFLKDTLGYDPDYGPFSGAFLHD